MNSSLVLVTVDCLRVDHVGFMGYQRPTTPFLDTLAAESFVFPATIAVGAPTFYSFPGILASRFPLALGRDVVGIAPGEPTLATVLRNNGYRTAAFVAANPYLSRRFGYDQGFGVFEDFLSPTSAGETNEKKREAPLPRMRTRVNKRIANLAHRVRPLKRLYDDLYFEYCQRIAVPNPPTWGELRRYPSADVLVNRACGWLESHGNGPFFLWLHFMDPHAPYFPPAEALSAMGVDIAPARGRYLNAAWNRADLSPERLWKYRDEILHLHDAGIRWVDSQLKKLVGCLSRSSRWDSCALVLTADHGEEFLDHGSRFHAPSRPYQELLQVPLLMRMPGTKPMALSRAPFSHVHLAPTILDAIGIEPPEEFQGSSMWGETKRGAGWEVAISESVGSCSNPMDLGKRMGRRLLIVQDQRHKLVVNFDIGRELLFDLEADPQELRPLQCDVDTVVRTRLLRVAQQHLETHENNSIRAGLRARVGEIRLEWFHSKENSDTLAS